MIIPVRTSVGKYDIILENGALKNIGKCFNLNRKVFIVTDSGVPKEYSETVAAACKQAFIATIPQGEASKQIETYKYLLELMVQNSMTRSDCIVSVGGGVVGDLAGFVAATYMRGIDFYNVPTTLLSQIDSSVGGKTAIDFCGLKNIVGAFYPPKGVLIDPNTLNTLPKRQINNGMAEIVKMAMTNDAELFSVIEGGNYKLDDVIAAALKIKIAVVEADEKESGLRKVLNFGHTLAHAIESKFDMEKYYHGECVAMGMIPMCGKGVRERLINGLCSLDLPTECELGANELLDACRHDKKMSGDSITVVFVEEIGQFVMKTMSFKEFEETVRKGMAK